MKRLPPLKPLTVLILLAVFSAFSVSAKHHKKDWIQLYNGEDLDAWTPKFNGYPLGYNWKNVFRVEDGYLTVSYDEVDEIKREFGHLFYKNPFSHYILRAEYRFVGEQVKGGPGWAFRNNGLMLHCQIPETMRVEQEFPVSLEVQLLGSLGDKIRTTANLCTPHTHVVMNGQLHEPHCTNSVSENFFGDQWVTVEVEIHGSAEVIHRVNGKVVMTYEKPQFNDGELVPGGYISIQAETAPIQFRKIELLPLPGNQAISHSGGNAPIID